MSTGTEAWQWEDESGMEVVIICHWYYSPEEPATLEYPGADEHFEIEMITDDCGNDMADRISDSDWAHISESIREFLEF